MTKRTQGRGVTRRVTERKLWLFTPEDSGITIKFEEVGLALLWAKSHSIEVFFLESVVPSKNRDLFNQYVN